MTSTDKLGERETCLLSQMKDNLAGGREGIEKSLAAVGPKGTLPRFYECLKSCDEYGKFLIFLLAFGHPVCFQNGTPTPSQAFSLRDARSVIAGRSPAVPTSQQSGLPAPRATPGTE